MQEKGRTATAPLVQTYTITGDEQGVVSILGLHELQSALYLLSDGTLHLVRLDAANRGVSAAIKVVDKNILAKSF